MTPVCSLGANLLKDEGAGYVAEALKINTTLKELRYAAAHPPHYCQQPLTPDQYSPLLPAHSLKRNQIQVQGAEALGEALTTNKSLTSLKYVASRPSSPCIINTKVSAAADTSV